MGRGVSKSAVQQASISDFLACRYSDLLIYRHTESVSVRIITVYYQAVKELIVYDGPRRRWIYMSPEIKLAETVQAVFAKRVNGKPDKSNGPVKEEYNPRKWGYPTNQRISFTSAWRK